MIISVPGATPWLPVPTGSDYGDPAPILVVDDQIPNLDAMEALLSPLECRLVRAHTADEALLALLEQDFAAIVLDIRMPGMSGIELADLIKTRPRSRHVPILFLTAHMFNEKDILRGYGTGAVDYLVKPIHGEILRSKISVFVELFRKTRELARVNDSLQREAVERARVEEALRLANQDLEQRVRDRTEALERADRRKDEFLAVLGHELRNPLAPIVSAIEVLEWTGVSESNASQARAVVRRQVRHMTRLIDDLLDVGRITSDRLVLQLSAVDLTAVIAAAVETSRPVIEEFGHRLTITSPTRSILLQVDAARLSQVLSNLLTNAAKYTPLGGEIHVVADADADGVVIRVRDDGVGIERQHLQSIFDLFVRVGQSDGLGGGGLGIGLALAQRFVQMHGGRLEATSEGTGKGSEFSIWLPPSILTDSAHEAGALGETDPQHRRRVLVVDDNHDAADMLSAMLMGWGHDARPAYESETALALAEEFEPEIALLDLGLPGMDGYTLGERLRSRPWACALVLVAVTGRGQEDDRARTRNAGFNDHLVKPVALEGLRSVINSSVGGPDRIPPR
jgi:signal transduction histidine kinase